MKIKIVLIIIAIQITVIAIIVHNIQQRVINRKSISSNPISGKDLVYPVSAKYKYFYEPKANSNDPDAPKNLPVNVTYTINSDSLNERFNYSVTKQDGIYRIITLGDSFTYGTYINTQDNWTEKLEDILNTNLKCKEVHKFEVINLGVRGYDNDYSVERYIRRGEKYDPDLVLWLQIDIERMLEKFRMRAEQYKIEDKTQKKFKNKQEKELYYNTLFLRARSDIVKEMGEAKILDYQRGVITKLKEHYEGPLILIALPVLKSEYETFLANLIKGSNNWFFDNQMRNFYDLDGNLPDGHPNEEGHKIIAEDIFNYLRSSRLINCD